MKFAVVVLACVLAAANAQFNKASAFASVGNNNFNRAGAYKPFKAQPVFQPFKAQQTYQPFRAQPFKSAHAVTVSPEPFEAVAVVAPAPSAYSVPVYKKTYTAASAYSGNAGGATILKYGNEVNPDGTYNYYYETDNGIAAQAQGSTRNLGGNPPVIAEVAQGSFSWTSPEGVPVAITYVADENGYQPQGDAIPTPPPVPPQIARALEYLARNAPRQ